MLLFVDIGKSHITNMSFNAIRKNKILLKISESTVLSVIRILIVKIKLPAKKQVLSFICKKDTFELLA